MIYLLTGHRDVGYELGLGDQTERDWRQLVESIEAECPVGAEVWKYRPDMRLAVLDHLALAHSLHGAGAEEFVFMADRLHIWSQIHHNEPPVRLLYKR